MIPALRWLTWTTRAGASLFEGTLKGIFCAFFGCHQARFQAIVVAQWPMATLRLALMHQAHDECTIFAFLDGAVECGEQMFSF